MSFDEWDEFSKRLQWKIAKRYPRTTNAFHGRVGIDWRSWADKECTTRVIGGKVVYLTSEQCRHIESLYSIIRRSEHLGKQARKAIVRDAMMERLAA